VSFHDHFSGVADQYAARRPVYPTELVERLSALAPPRDARRPRRAWDAGCGSGQLSTLLAGAFDEVYGTDASPQQIAAAKSHPRVEYRVAPAEASGLPDAAIDLCVAAQAAHWFDLDAYYAEVRRVSAPGALVALVVYSRPSVDGEVDPALQSLYRAVDPYWPPERTPVDELYANLPFPFDQLDVPRMSMTLEWPLDHLLGYAETWSSTIGFVRAHGREQLTEAVLPLREAWGDPERPRVVRWPLAVRAGRVRGGRPANGAGSSPRL
jgi:SAM-dependent methyltransferase